MAMTPDNIIGAFSEDQVSRLTGLTRAQLRRWNHNEFIRPEYRVNDNPRQPFSYIYSFKDLLKLRVLNQLRNVHGVSMSELRKVEQALAHMGDDKWTSQKLWVHSRKVVFEEPESSRKREVASKQFVAEIALEIVTSDARKDILKLNRRDGRKVGKIEKRRQVHSSDPVFSGTRIPVSAVIGFMDAGYSDEQILDQFPGLEPDDLHAARQHASSRAA